MLICNVVGARPNFMKIAPIVHALRQRQLPQILVHTGQHYDSNMSQVFFEELGLPEPDMYLGIGSDTHARQTAQIMTAFEEICQEQYPSLVIVGGDVNSTLATALVAAKLHIPVAHVEAGLRSFDRTMPEEINRVLTDHLSQFLFTTEVSAQHNLQQEGISEEHIYFVGNCMVDTLLTHVDMAVSHMPWKQFSLQPQEYVLLTLHRPSNVDEPQTVWSLIETMNELSEQLPIVFPVHPRTRRRMQQWGIHVHSTIHICDPLPYITFLGLMAKARCVLTDSGGIQEETTALSVPCLTLRWNTERPVTVMSGTNHLVGTDPIAIHQGLDAVLANDFPPGTIPPLWDGQAAQRIVDVLERWISETFHKNMDAG